MLLSHGRPGSIIEYLDVIGPLTEPESRVELPLLPISIFRLRTVTADEHEDRREGEQRDRSEHPERVRAIGTIKYGKPVRAADRGRVASRIADLNRGRRGLAGVRQTGRRSTPTETAVRAKRWIFVKWAAVARPEPRGAASTALSTTGARSIRHRRARVLG